VTVVDDTPEEAAFRAEVREALAVRLRPKPEGAAFSIMGAGRDDLEEGRRFLALLADGGYAVPTWPVEHGGLAATPDQAAIIAQELSGFDVPDLYPFMVGIALVGPTIMTHGTPEQQARWLLALRSGKEVWCQLFSEPDAGSDLAGLTCRAERDGEFWSVTGSKVWSSRAHYSQWGLLLARTNTAVPKHVGITAFALRMHAPGVDVRPLRQMNGDTHFNQVFLDSAPIPDRDRIGDVGGGWRVAITTLMHERGSIGGGFGVSRAELLAHAHAHERGGADDPVTRDRLAQAVAALEVSRMTGLRARAVARAGRIPGPEGSGAKLRMASTLKEIGDLGVDLLGPAGVVAEGPGEEWRTLFLTGPSLSIRGGTDEIQRNILGERVLGLPPEPRVDKDRPFSEGSRG
jgi:alkylation response protein AidB-like acyl-CoA dehydrogenase